MSQRVSSTHTGDPKIRRGVAYFELLRADGKYEASIPLAPASALTYTQSVTEVTLISKMRGLGTVYASANTSIDRDMKLTCEGMNKQILRSWLAGALNRVSQASGTESAEESPYVAVDATIHLGGATNSGAGIYAVSSVTVQSYEGANASAFQTAHAYAVGDVLIPTGGNLHWYMVTTAGTSAGSAPTFPTDGTTVSSNGVVIQDMGLITYVAGTDYELDADRGILSIPSTGAIATAIGRVPASLGKTFRLTTAYTRAAKTFDQLQTAAGVTAKGRFRFRTENALGTDEDWYAPSVTIKADGEIDLLGDEFESIDFAIKVLTPSAGEALTINNVPA